jgi:hypothetical protein
MKYLLAAVYAVLLATTPNISRAEDIARFAPLKTDELTPPQKAWADMIAAPPRNAKFVNPGISGDGDRRANRPSDFPATVGSPHWRVHGLASVPAA